MTTRYEFIEAIFGKAKKNSKAKPLFCGFPDDPQRMKFWTPKIMDKRKFPIEIKKTNNNYFTVSTFIQDQSGNYRAGNEQFVAGHAFLLDDLGTKVDIEINLPLSWMIKTSSGNFQGGLLLDVPCTDRKLYSKIVKKLGEKGLSDPGAAGAARWARLPYGVNTKQKYLVDGVPPKVKLVQWNPKNRYSIEKIIEAFKLEVMMESNIESKSTSDNSKVSLLSVIKAAGLWKNEIESGRHDISCPWLNLHTEQVNHGTVYFEPSHENRHAGGFKCQHGHCSTRDITDLKNYFGITSNAQRSMSHLETAFKCVDDLHVFHDENGEPFIFLNGSCLPLKGRDVKAYITRKIHSTVGKAMKQSNISEVLAFLESKALCEGNKLKMHNRIAMHKNYIWYDLGDGKSVKVGRKGWQIVESPPLFRRYGHQKIQTEPISGGAPWKLFDYLNIAEDHQLETLVLLISFLVPEISHPIFHPHGAQGSGKTTLCKMIKKLLDPSTLEVLFAPKDKQELIRQINRHHIPLFDNMSKIDSEMSDILCQACTGGGMAKRALYSDDDDHIYNFKRCIGLNGINLLVTKPDLLDRTMLLQLERIMPEKRKEEVEIWREFEEAKPEILGGMFDVLAKAKAKYPKVKLDQLPRLADFAKWGYAIAEALGKGKGKQFLAAYQANIKRQSAEVLQNNSLCLAVTLLMKAKGNWEGTVKEAHEKLSQIVTPSKTDNTFPADAKNLRKHLERIQSTLAESENITYRYSERPKKDGYHIEFIKNT